MNSLRAFEAAARHLSFTKAAEELHVTRAAISHQIKALENYFGEQLFRRIGRGIALGDNVEPYFEEVRKALDGLSAAGDILTSSLLERTLKLSVAPTFGTRWLLPRLRQFHASHSEISLNPEWSTDVVDFKTAQIDLAIRHGKGDWPNVSAQLLYLEHLAPAFAPGFFPNNGPRLTPGEIVQHQLLSAEALRGEWEAWCEKFGLPEPNKNQIIYVPTHAHAIDAAQAGMGIVLTDHRLIEVELSNQRLVHDVTMLTVSRFGIFAVYKKNSTKISLIITFLDWLNCQIAAYNAEHVRDGRKNL